jgi:hypothetical protein
MYTFLYPIDILMNFVVNLVEMVSLCLTYADEVATNWVHSTEFKEMVCT